MDAPSDIDALAEALREDGVVVDRVMGSGEAQEAHDRIAALVRETPFPVYVALVEQPDGLPEDSTAAGDALAGLLNRRLGDGLFVLETTGSAQRVWSYGPDADPSRLSLAAYANGDVLDFIEGDRTVHYYRLDLGAWSRTGYGSLERDLLGALRSDASARKVTRGRR